MRHVTNKKVQYIEGEDYFAGVIPENNQLLISDACNVSLNIGKLSLYGAKIKYVKSTNITEIEIDPYAIYPLYVIQFENGGYLIANSTFVISYFLPGAKLDASAIKTFFSKGYLFPHQTFIKNCVRIVKNTVVSPRSELKYNPLDYIWPFSPTYSKSLLRNSTSFQNLFELFEARLAESLPSPESNTIFQMSGGADSRLLSILYLKNNKNHPVSEIAVSPWIVDAGNIDMDAYIAQKWCQKHNIEHSIRTLDLIRKDYIPFFSDRPRLSGMLGGDYWGGTFQLSLPTDIMSQHKLISSFIEDKRQLEEELNEISTQPENILKSLRRQIFVQSNRSVLFGNIRSGFACPAANPRRSYSPFMSTKMIQLFLLCDDDLLENYQFFIEVLKKLETAGDYFFPICSFLNSVDNRWDAPQGWGVSPKLQMPAYSPTKKNEWNENLKLFKNLLENQCDGFLPEEIEKILNHSELEGLFTGLVYSFLYSFHARFLEVYKNRIEIESK